MKIQQKIIICERPHDWFLHKKLEQKKSDSDRYLLEKVGVGKLKKEGRLKGRGEKEKIEGERDKPLMFYGLLPIVGYKSYTTQQTNKSENNMYFQFLEST